MQVNSQQQCSRSTRFAHVCTARNSLAGISFQLCSCSNADDSSDRRHCTFGVEGEHNRQMLQRMNGCPHRIPRCGLEYTICMCCALKMQYSGSFFLLPDILVLPPDPECLLGQLCDPRGARKHILKVKVNPDDRK